MSPRRDLQQLLDHLRDVIEDSDVPRRQIDEHLGHSAGYLSQLLAGTLDLKYWHLIGILDAIDCPPKVFFAGAFPLPGPRPSKHPHPALEAALTIDRSMVGIYGFGVDAIRELRQRLEGVEEALYGEAAPDGEEVEDPATRSTHDRTGHPD